MANFLIGMLSGFLIGSIVHRVYYRARLEKAAQLLASAVTKDQLEELRQVICRGDSANSKQS